jgi:hypothetical protein
VREGCVGLLVSEVGKKERKREREKERKKEKKKNCILSNFEKERFSREGERKGERVRE